ncbi:MAG: SH3 domain-containing protein [Rhodobacteraceae bacterium]|nr:SH3 domain-containing protein [Paracoccaceae bacterium]
MKQIILFIVAVLLSAPALAQSLRLPAIFSVTGVAANDTLNIRSQPNGESADIGDLFPNQLVEVITIDANNRWGKVAVNGEQSGWVSMRYLAPITPQPTLGSVPTSLICSGTEPFWSLNITTEASLSLSIFGETTTSEPITRATTSVNSGDMVNAYITQNMTALLRRANCTDGMSDRDFGWALDLIDTRNGISLLSGCCTADLP